MDTPPRQRNSIVGGLLVLVARGVLVWVVVPIAFVVWPIVRARQGRTGVRLGQYLGWVDLNLIACLQRLATPMLIRHPVAWTPMEDISKVTHRLRAFDPV